MSRESYFDTLVPIWSAYFMKKISVADREAKLKPLRIVLQRWREEDSARRKAEVVVDERAWT